MSKHREYELTFVFHPQYGEEERNSFLERVLADVAVESEAELPQPTVNNWGLRNLAYEIKDQREGFYVLCEGPMDGRKFQEVERLLNYNDNVLRYLFVRKED